MALPPTRVTALLVNSGVPVPPELLYRVKVTVPVGLSPPLTVALSAMEVPTVALAGCWLVLMVGVAALMTTGSEAVPLLTALLLLSPL